MLAMLNILFILSEVQVKSEQFLSSLHLTKAGTVMVLSNVHLKLNHKPYRPDVMKFVTVEFPIKNTKRIFDNTELYVQFPQITCLLI
jgi:hypothetical protein